MQTNFTKAFSLQTPIVGAAMTGVAGPDLCAAISVAGAFGFLAAQGLATSKATLTKDLDSIRKQLGVQGRLPIGVGFLGWCLDNISAKDATEAIEVACEQASAVWLSFGNDLSRWVKLIRTPNSAVKLFLVVSNVKEGLAALELGADVLIVQGIEAGGHGSASGLPLLSFLPMMLDALPTNNRPLVIAAGGIVTGSQVAAALTIGADGVVLGTALLATPEAILQASQRQAVVGATGNATSRSMIFDEMRDTKDWPSGIDGRALINTTVREHLEGKRTMQELKEDFAKAMKDSDTDRICVWAGTSVPLVKKQQSASALVHEITEDAIACLQRASKIAVA